MVDVNYYRTDCVFLIRVFYMLSLLFIYAGKVDWKVFCLISIPLFYYTSKQQRKKEYPKIKQCSSSCYIVLEAKNAYTNINLSHTFIAMHWNWYNGLEVIPQFLAYAAVWDQIELHSSCISNEQASRNIFGISLDVTATQCDVWEDWCAKSYTLQLYSQPFTSCLLVSI